MPALNVTAVFPLEDVDTSSSSNVAPACARASLTALIIAVEVSVEPDTASTFGDCASTIAPGRSAIAPSEIPAVSECSVISTDSILSAETVTETVTGPL